MPYIPKSDEYEYTYYDGTNGTSVQTWLIDHGWDNYNVSEAVSNSPTKPGIFISGYYYPDEVDIFVRSGEYLFLNVTDRHGGSDPLFIVANPDDYELV